MPNWTEPMTQTYEYYTVNPGTWKDVKKLDMIKLSSIVRDSETDTLGSASFDTTEMISECYIRAYLVTIQNGITERFPLGTFLAQTPSSSFNGKVLSATMDAYTPLIELKENPLPIGYSVLKDENIMDRAYQIVRDNTRAPIVKAVSDKKIYFDFVASMEDNGVSFVRDFISYADHELGLDELGRILFMPKQDLASMQPVWTFNDDNSSILHPDITTNHDIFGIPNVVEVVYSGTHDTYNITVVNDDPNSPVSTVNRGRILKYRDTNPSLIGEATENQVQEYAEKLLKNLSTVEFSVSYKHGYCPVRLGDCVRLNYERAGLHDVKAKVVSQNINCKTGCTVSEKAIFTKSLWG